MNKQETIKQLESIRNMSRDLYEGEDDIYKEDSIHKEDLDALNTAISIMKKEESRKFNRSFLDKFLDEIIEEYFSEDTIKYGLGMWEVIDYVKRKYSDEIYSLPE